MCPERVYVYAYTRSRMMGERSGRGAVPLPCNENILVARRGELRYKIKLHKMFLSAIFNKRLSC